MELELQIQSLIFSLVFGMFFAFMFNLFYKYLFNGKIIFKIITNFVFVSINTLLYFLLLRMINDGIVHVYFIFMVVTGFVIGNIKTRVIRRYNLAKF